MWRAANQEHLDEVLAALRRREGGEHDDGASSGDDFEAEGRTRGDEDEIPF